LQNPQNPKSPNIAAITRQRRAETKIGKNRPFEA